MIDFDNALAVTAVLLLAGIVKGATGIGYASCALPMLVELIGLKSAMALTIIPTVAANVAATFSFGAIKPTLIAFMPLYIAAVPGVGIGLMLLMWVDPVLPVAGLGITMVLYAALALCKLQFVISETDARRFRIPVGFVGGLLAGLTGSQVVPLVPYMLAQPMDEKRVIQAINIGVLVLSVTIGLGMFASHTVNGLTFAASLLAVAPALLGTALGVMIQCRLQGLTLRRLVLFVIGLTGIKLVISSIWSVYLI